MPKKRDRFGFHAMYQQAYEATMCEVGSSATRKTIATSGVSFGERLGGLEDTVEELTLIHMLPANETKDAYKEWWLETLKKYEITGKGINYKNSYKLATIAVRKLSQAHRVRSVQLILETILSVVPANNDQTDGRLNRLTSFVESARD